MSRQESNLRRRVHALTWLMIVGLVVSGITAIPLKREIDWLVRHTPSIASSSETTTDGVAPWLLKIRDAIRTTDSQFPFLFYGTDWLAFGHFVIAVAFIGALRHPVRNRWLFDFGLIACAMVIPYALIMGAARGIPLWWRLVDCSFGVFGAIPMLLCRRYVDQLEARARSGSSAGRLENGTETLASPAVTR